VTSAIDELITFVHDNSTMRFYFARLGPHGYVQIAELLERFLRTTMDQVRVKYAQDCTTRILKMADLDDLELFREGVWKREVTGVIAFQGQRDHTAHTLNNWLLGWYLYTKCTPIRNSIERAIVRRGWDAERSGGFSNVEYFGHVWLYASLLHDIGYLFEGSLEAMETGFESARATIGLRVTDEYFHATLWRHTSLTSADDRLLTKEEERKLPVAPTEPSLSRIALYLRSLGDLDTLRKQLRAVLGKRKAPRPPRELPGDAFELWAQHFEAFGQSVAAERMKQLQDAFEHYVSRGIPSLGIRVLDHGICSGLLLLKIATFFYQFFASVENKVSTPAGPRKDREKLKRAATKLISRSLPYSNDYEFWWSGIVWGTAATALHNMCQQKNWGDGIARKPLKLEDEPMTYLGVLVDCLQDWDRYYVFESIDRSPVQGVDVQLSGRSDRVSLRFPRSVDKLKKDLDTALSGWTDFVDLCAQ
jgi:hypothetical protein